MKSSGQGEETSPCRVQIRSEGHSFTRCGPPFPRVPQPLLLHLPFFVDGHGRSVYLLYTFLSSCTLSYIQLIYLSIYTPWAYAQALWDSSGLRCRIFPHPLPLLYGAIKNPASSLISARKCESQTRRLSSLKRFLLLAMETLSSKPNEEQFSWKTWATRPYNSPGHVAHVEPS